MQKKELVEISYILAENLDKEDKCSSFDNEDKFRSLYGRTFSDEDICDLIVFALIRRERKNELIK